MQNDTHHDSHHDTREARPDVGGYRRIELISGTVRRRRWSDEERAQILAESFEPGANISAVARRHGVSGGLLHCWRKQARALAREGASSDAPTFVPVTIADAGCGVRAETETVPTTRMIEIETSGALVRVPAGVDARTLSVVLTALRRAS
ncbi:MAG: transposase [Alphaproteobacteria bacterium]|nr:transposase [Alphaproteobacteria bacterium]